MLNDSGLAVLAAARSLSFTVSMKLILPIDPFQLTQEFGVNAADYARFGLKGHNGWDIRTIYPDTPNGKRSILAPQDIAFYRQGNEGNDGFGLYFEVITYTSKGMWKHTFAHCDHIDVFIKRNQGEVMAVSDNTGNSTAPHLHWTVKRLKPDGTVKDYSNGYFGAVNPQEYIDEVRADIINSPQIPMANLPAELQKYSLNWKQIAVDKGFDVNDSKIPEFVEYVNTDKIMADKVAKALKGQNDAIVSVGLDPQDLLGSLNKKLADERAKCQDTEAEQLRTLLRRFIL